MKFNCPFSSNTPSGCGHCQSLAPEYKKAATQLKGIVSFVAVDLDSYRELGGPYNIQGFPTIKVFSGANDKKPADYQGPRTAAGLVKHALSEVEKLVSSRGGSGGGKKSSSNSGGGGNSNEPGGGKYVSKLTAANFKDKTAGGNKDVWMVEFYAPWCGHCKQLAPVWAEAAEKLDGVVKFGAVNCDDDANKPLCGQFGVEGFPTIKAVQDGKLLKDYEAGRDLESIVNYANGLAEKHGPLPEVNQLYSKKIFESDCAGKSLCVVGILPHIMDTGASGRERYISIMQEASKKFRSSQWGWMWTEVGQQQKLQDLIGIPDAPSLFAISVKKQRVGRMKGAFALTEIADFARGLQSGRIKTTEISFDVEESIADSEKWDGKDGEMLVEEEFDLDELMNSDA